MRERSFFIRLRIKAQENSSGAPARTAGCEKMDGLLWTTAHTELSVGVRVPVKLLWVTLEWAVNLVTGSIIENHEVC